MGGNPVREAHQTAAVALGAADAVIAHPDPQLALVDTPWRALRAKRSAASVQRSATMK